jgi:hypothetical protein
MRNFYFSAPFVSFIAFLLGMVCMYIFFPRIEGIRPFVLRAPESSAFPFINELLECGDVSGSLPAEVKATEEEVRAFIQTEKSSGSLTDIGLYYRDLSNGPVFGINEQTEFSPGSLLKVPLLFAIYKEKETDSRYFDMKIEYTGGASSASQDIAVGQPIAPGHTYTIQELMSHMIQQSDNNAALLLYQLLGLFDKNALFILYSPHIKFYMYTHIHQIHKSKLELEN